MYFGMYFDSKIKNRSQFPQATEGDFKGDPILSNEKKKKIQMFGTYILKTERKFSSLSFYLERDR